MFTLCNKKKKLYDKIKSDEAQRYGDTRRGGTKGKDDDTCDVHMISIGLERRAK